MSDLVQRAQPLENKLFRKCFIIIAKLQSIIFLSNELEKTTINCFPVLKNVFSLNININIRILSAGIINTTIEKQILIISFISEITYKTCLLTL